MPSHAKAFRPPADDDGRPNLFDFGSRTVREVLDWYETHETGDNPGALAERQRVRGLFAADFGEWDLAKCRPFHLQAWIQRQPDLASGWTTKRWAATILRPFNFAAKLGLIGRNPFAGVSFAEGKDGRDLTEDEFRSMLRHATPPFRRVLTFLRLSGARPGELRGLLPQHVRLRPDGTGCLMLGEHKTGKKTRKPRHIEMPRPLVLLVKHLLVDADHRAAQGLTTHLFVNTFLRPWQTGALCKAVQKIRAKAGLPEDAKLYGCRHSFGTGAIVNGVNLAVVAELMGHANFKTTQRYIHLADKKDHLTAAIEQATKRK